MKIALMKLFNENKISLSGVVLFALFCENRWVEQMYGLRR